MARAYLHAAHLTGATTTPGRLPGRTDHHPAAGPLDPGDPAERKMILEKLTGKVVDKVKRKKTETGWLEEVVDETVGGILHWGAREGQTRTGSVPRSARPTAGVRRVC